MKIKQAHKDILVLSAVSLFFFMAGNQILSLTSPDEVFYAQTANEMMQRGEWLTPYLFDAPQFEKPILTYWLLRVAFMIFGVTDFAARFFPAVFAWLGVLALYQLGLAGFNDRKKALLSSLALASSVLYIGMARTVFTDMIFSVLILLSLAAFYIGYVRKEAKTAGLIIFGGSAGLAVLAKGPLGLLIPFAVIIVFLAFRKDLKFIFSWSFLAAGALCALICLPWYIAMYKMYGHAFTHEFFYNDHIRRLFFAEHRSNDTWYFYPATMVGMIFPWSLYVLAGGFIWIRRAVSGKAPSALYAFTGWWVLVVFAVFQAAHSKLVSYILPLFPALALFVGDFFQEQLASKRASKVFFYSSLVTAGVLFFAPAGIFAAMKIYSAKFVIPPEPVYFLMVLCLGLASLDLLFILKRKFLAHFCLLTVLVTLFLGLLSTAKGLIEPYASCKAASDYLVQNYDVRSPVISSKMFVRGVRYSTGKEVAVLTSPENFFSPHPIEHLQNDGQREEFFRKHKETYGIINKSAWNDISNMQAQGLKRQLLKVIGDKYIVRIERVN